MGCFAVGLRNDGVATGSTKGGTYSTELGEVLCIGWGRAPPWTAWPYRCSAGGAPNPVVQVANKAVQQNDEPSSG